MVPKKKIAAKKKTAPKSCSKCEALKKQVADLNAELDVLEARIVNLAANLTKYKKKLKSKKK